MQQQSPDIRQEELTLLKKIEAKADAVLQIKNPNNDEMELAFDLNPELALKFEVLSEEIQEFLVGQNPENIKYILHPSKKVERYIVSRGFRDFRNGNYYWKLSEKKPKSLSARIQAHPFTVPPTIAFLFVIRIIIARPALTIYIAIRSLLKGFSVWKIKKTRRKFKSSSETFTPHSVFTSLTKIHIYGGKILRTFTGKEGHYFWSFG